MPLPTLTFPFPMNSTTLMQNLTNAEEALVQARMAIVNEIIARLGDVPPSQFATICGINRGNLHSLLKGRWNAVIAVQCLLALDGMPAEPEKPKQKRHFKRYEPLEVAP